MTEPTHVVAKPFNTPSQRFAVGREVSASDIPPGGPMAFDDYVAGKFLVGINTKAAGKAQEQAETAPPNDPPADPPAPPADPAASDEAARGRGKR